MGRTRIRLLLAAVLLIPFLFYWGTGNTPSERTSLQAPAAGIDSFMTGLQVTEYNVRGDVAQRLQASHLEHKQNISYLTLPVLQHNSDQGAQSWIEAERGTLDDSQQRLDLFENIRLQRRLNNGSHQQLNTEQLSWYPQQQQLTSQAEVVFTMPGHQIRATGLTADLTSGKIDLLSGVKGQHEHEQ